MPKLEEEPLTLVQIRLFESDLKTIKTLYGASLGVNKAIRVIVRTFLRQVEAKAKEDIDKNEALPALTLAEIEKLETLL